MITVPGGLRVVLASGSPRRAELLGSVGLPFEIAPAHVDETLRTGEAPDAYVLRLSAEKAATATGPSVIAIGADTTVEIDGEVLAKPIDGADAARMLGLLSGRTHLVHTGVTVAGADDAGEIHARHDLVTTAVRFVELERATIDWYVATGEPFDKAGGYAIQGAGAALVAGVDGSVSNVIGLPLAETLALLRTLPGFV